MIGLAVMALTLVTVPGTEINTAKTVAEIAECIDLDNRGIMENATTISRPDGARVNVWVQGPLSRAWLYSVDIQDRGADRQVMLLNKKAKAGGGIRKLYRKMAERCIAQ